MTLEKAKQIINNELSFDRTYNCDFCDKKTLVAWCNYGTSHYSRLICKECVERIKANNKILFNEDNVCWYNEESIEDAKSVIERGA